MLEGKGEDEGRGRIQYGCQGLAHEMVCEG